MIRQLFPPRLRRDEDLQQPTPSHAKLLLMTRQVSLIKLGTSYLFQHVQLPASLFILTFTVNGAVVLLNYGEVLYCLFVWVFFFISSDHQLMKKSPAQQCAVVAFMSPIRTI